MTYTTHNDNNSDVSYVAFLALSLRSLEHSMAADGVDYFVARLRLHAVEGGCVASAGYICRSGASMVCASWAKFDHSHSLYCGAPPPRLRTVQVTPLAHFITCWNQYYRCLLLFVCLSNAVQEQMFVPQQDKYHVLARTSTCCTCCSQTSMLCIQPHSGKPSSTVLSQVCNMSTWLSGTCACCLQDSSLPIS